MAWKLNDTTYLYFCLFNIKPKISNPHNKKYLKALHSSDHDSRYHTHLISNEISPISSKDQTSARFKLVNVVKLMFMLSRS